MAVLRFALMSILFCFATFRGSRRPASGFGSGVPKIWRSSCLKVVGCRNKHITLSACFTFASILQFCMLCVWLFRQAMKYSGSTNQAMVMATWQVKKIDDIFVLKGVILICC